MAFEWSRLAGGTGPPFFRFPESLSPSLPPFSLPANDKLLLLSLSQKT